MFNGNDEDFEIDEEFLQDILPSGSTENKAEKRKSDEHVVVEAKKSCDAVEVDDDELISEELLSLADYAEAEFVSQVNSPEFRGVTVRPRASSPEYGREPRNNIPDRPASKTKRKFPGPAGLLPQLERSMLDCTDVDINESSSEKQSTPLNAPVSSQSPAEITSGPAWQEAARSLQMRPGEVSCPLGRFTVAWVRQRAVAKRLPQHKVPFLLVGVRNVDPSSRDPSVTLQDASGEMHGILHRELWAEYAAQLVPGAVLALRQVGVLSTGPFARHQCLNVTANNVVVIFAPESSQGAQTTHVRPVSRAQLLREIEVPDSPASPTPAPSQRLFSSIGSSSVPRSPASSMGSPLQTSTPKLASKFFSKQSTSNQNHKSGNSDGTTCTQPSSKPQFTPRSASSGLSQFHSKPTQAATKPPFTPRSANSNPIVSQLTPKTTQPVPKSTFTPKNTNITTGLSQFTPKTSVNSNSLKMLTPSTQNTQRNAFELAKLPSVSYASALDSNLQNITNRTNSNIPSAQNAANISVNSKDKVQTSAVTKNAFFTPKQPSVNYASPPPAQQSADLQSLLEGINPEDLFDDF